MSCSCVSQAVLYPDRAMFSADPETAGVIIVLFGGRLSSSDRRSDARVEQTNLASWDKGVRITEVRHARRHAEGTYWRVPTGRRQVRPGNRFSPPSRQRCSVAGVAHQPLITVCTSVGATVLHSCRSAPVYVGR